MLSEYVKHHVKEEESEMFPKAKKSAVDLKSLGAQLQARKEMLTKLDPQPLLAQVAAQRAT